MLFLAFVRTAHFWTPVHPELAFEPNLEALLREHEDLAEPPGSSGKHTRSCRSPDNHSRFKPGFHAFRRATSKYLRKASGIELAAVQLGHKRITTTDEHYNDRDMDDLKKAAELVESAFILSFAPIPDFAPDVLKDLNEQCGL